MDYETETLVVGAICADSFTGGASGRPEGAAAGHFVAHTLRGSGFDASEDGTGRGTPLVAFHTTQDPISSREVSHALGCGGRNGQGDVGVAYAVALRGREGGGTAEFGGEVANTVGASQGGSDKPFVLQSAVRRLTPRECERLQGLPDDYTLVPWRGGMATDGPRYKAIGNGMAVVCLDWIFDRIDAALRRIA